jgi:hypothetical protein
MSNTADTLDVVRHYISKWRGFMVLAAFIATSLLSALLLFLVQPLMARYMLPLFGGSSAVWAVTMCFFQFALLLGYGYAHILNRFLPLRFGIVLHCVLMLAASTLLPIELSEQSLASNSSVPEGVALLMLLAGSIGLPFAVMSANAPLIQSWFSASGHKDAAEPYFLYGASNLGSIAALLVYPALIEPNIGLHEQAGLWARGFMSLSAALLVCGALIAGRQHTAYHHTGSSADAVSWSRWGYWLMMAFLPSALLVAWTNHMTTDVATAPFLWLPPLILYLVSFIAVFRAKPWFNPAQLRVAQLVTVPLTFVLAGNTHHLLFIPLMLAGAIAFFSTACLCHLQMFTSRPDASRLTGFYLTMSLGGVLGGLFVSLLAPVLFQDVSEYGLLLLMAVFCAPDIFGDAKIREQFRKPVVLLLAGVAVGVVFHFAGAFFGKAEWLGQNALLLGFCAAAIALFANAQRKLLISIFIFLLVTRAGVHQDPLVHQSRNFFGVLTVKQSSDFSIMYHGTTVHGAQAMADLQLPAGQKPAPMTYYAKGGGMAQALGSVKQRLQHLAREKSFGIVGLGAGSLVCYRDANENWTTFEINPDVVKAARDPKLFNFMDRCGAGVPVVIGDARLTMQNEKPDSYDALVIDAFSSDSIPVHLLTTQAMQLYFKLLRDDGILILHISNRYMDLSSVVAANSDGLAPFEGEIFAREIFHIPKRVDFSDTASKVVVLSRSKEAIDAVAQNPEAKPLAAAPAGMRAWTDDYSDLLGVILLSFKK